MAREDCVEPPASQAGPVRAELGVPAALAALAFRDHAVLGALRVPEDPRASAGLPARLVILGLLGVSPSVQAVLSALCAELPPGLC